MAKALSMVPRLAVADLRRSIDYYTTVLGFEPGSPVSEDAVFAILAREDVRLQLIKIDQWHPEGKSTFSINVTGALEMHATVRRLATIEWGPEVFWYGRREFAILDPDGHRVIISEATDEPPTCREFED